jgi:hypothetical protein
MRGGDGATVPLGAEGAREKVQSSLRDWFFARFSQRQSAGLLSAAPLGHESIGLVHFLVQFQFSRAQ